MNPPPNGVWKIQKSNPVAVWDALYWNGSVYVDYNNITEGNASSFDDNPEWQKDTSIGTYEAGIDDIPGKLLKGVEAVATKVKFVFRKETYNTPTKRKNAIYIILFAAAIVFGLLIYTKRIKI